MQVILTTTIDSTYYEKDEPENGTQERFEVDSISFAYNGIKLTSLNELEDIIINHNQKELVDQLLHEIK